MDKVNVSEIQQINESQDLFDLDKGDFDEPCYDEREAEENQQVYQMYEELCNLVQQEYRPGSDDEEASPSEGSAAIQTRDTPVLGSDESDDEIERNPKASPLIKDADQKPKRNKWAEKKKYAPRLTEVQEETEPESSFKETERKKNRGYDVHAQQLQSDIATVIE